LHMWFVKKNAQLRWLSQSIETGLMSFIFLYLQKTFFLFYEGE